MLQDHYNVTFEVKRKTTTDRKTTFATIATGVRGHKQPAQAEYQLNTPGEWAKNFVLMTYSDIQIGDQLVIDGKTYTVHGAQQHNFRIGTRHTEVFIHTN